MKKKKLHVFCIKLKRKFNDEIHFIIFYLKCNLTFRIYEQKARPKEKLLTILSAQARLVC
jgi:hypothetical protein